MVDGTGWHIESKSHPELTKLMHGKQPWQNIEIWHEGGTEKTCQFLYAGRNKKKK